MVKFWCYELTCWMENENCRMDGMDDYTVKTTLHFNTMEEAEKERDKLYSYINSKFSFAYESRDFKNKKKWRIRRKEIKYD